MGMDMSSLRFLQLTKKNVLLLMELGHKGAVSTREQTVYSPFAFYLNIGILKQFGLIQDFMQKENRKNWVLTDRGLKFVELIKKIEKVLEVEKSVKGKSSVS